MNDYSKFSVELYNLWRAGYIYIPKVADAYADSARSLSGGNGKVTAAFARQSGDSTPVSTAFTNLSEHTQIVLGRISDNLYAVGETLTRLADHYAATDDDNSTRIDYESQKRDNADPNPGKGLDKYGRPTSLDRADPVKGANDTYPDDRKREHRESSGEETNG